MTLEKDSAHEHYLRALDLETADRMAARSAYEACLAGDCTHLEARINLGRLLHLAGLNREAERIYRDNQQADATLYFNLGVLMEDMGRETEALELYREAVIHDPGMADAHFNLSMILDRRGEAQSAYRHLLAFHRLTRAQAAPESFVDGEPEG